LYHQPITDMKKYLLLPAFILLSQVIAAQVTAEPAWKPMEPGTSRGVTDFLFGLQVGVPSKEMKPAIHNQMGDVGFGAGLMVLSDPFMWGKNKRESVLRLGGGLGYTYYGRFKTDLNVNGYSGSLKTAYGILDAKAMLRFRPQLNRGINPFADIQAGGDFYMSTTSDDLNAIESALGLENTDFESTSSAAFTKGLGGGIAIGSKDPEQAKFVVRVMYNWGSKVKYIVRNSVEYHPSENALTYQTARAPVRYVMLQVGIGL
jgi:hypothetical protein